MKHELAAILASLEKPLLLEQRRGFADDAISGEGLSEYAARWCQTGIEAAEPGVKQRFRRIAASLEGYGALSRQQREAGVAQALGLAREIRSIESRRLEQELDSPYEERGAKGGKKRWPSRLSNMGITTARDLIYHFPRDYAPLKTIAQLRDGERACVLARAVRRHVTPLRGAGRMVRTRYNLEVEDETGKATVTSFAQSARHRSRSSQFSPLALPYDPGAALLVDGNVKRLGPFVEITYIDVQPADGLDFLKPGQLVPVYPLTEGIYQNQLRGAIRGLLDRHAAAIPDPMPDGLRRRHRLVGLAAALPQIHWPESQQRLESARRRLVFEEFLFLQLALAARREDVKRQGGERMSGMQQAVRRLGALLPYELTAAQLRTTGEIGSDMASGRVMSRLLQGDVGSGKTVVALTAVLLAVGNGFQGALMAPTEILAEQHFLVLSHLLEPLGITAELLVGSIRSSRKKEVQERVRSGEAHVVVGTHALIEEAVAFKALGLAVIDEQHRFGVLQRARLQQKGISPGLHVLVMTATPIPRTLALTVYGDLDVSVLDEMPPGRQPVETRWCDEKRLGESYSFVRRQVEEGRQAYIVCPLIEESEKLQAQAATRLAEELRGEVFPDLRVGLLHGRLKTAEKDQVMEAFRNGHLDILATTTVIEVGVDVPNASVMVILNAERFGLAQLHQLRGRVGRSTSKGYCILVSDARYDPRFSRKSSDDSAEQGYRRLRVMLEQNDGFAIAEEDLRLRGPGEFYGTRQHGLPDLKLARLIEDQPLLEEARAAAFDLVESDPELSAPEHSLLADRVRRIRSMMDSAPP